ncbi:MAG: SRPBCC family protein [Acidimicrobiales bacterium]
MVSVVRSRVIAASSDEVWAALSDFASISAWAPNVDHSCLLTEQTEGVGTTRRIQTGRITLVETVETYEPGRTLAYRLTGLPPVIRSVTNTWQLAPSGDQTSATLTSQIDAGPRLPQKAIARAVGRRLGAASEQMLDGLAAHFAPEAGA